jgi:polyisoprenyl-teichoic acid--peptidoglycan teichoic acid transferase
VVPSFVVEKSLSRVARIGPVPSESAVVGRPHPDVGAAVAAFLSFVVPGLGQAYNRQMLLAWMLALPVLILVIGAVVVLLLLDVDVLSHLLDIRFLVALIVLDVALLGWRAIAIVQAFSARRVSRRRGAPTYITAGLLLIAIAMHAVPAMYAAKAIDTLNAVALGGDGGGFGERPVPGFVPRTDPLPAPSDHPETGGGERFTFLLVGVDSGFNRDWALTDTMLVVSIDPDGTSAMISVPRDLYGVRLPDGTVYQDKLNSLLSVADGDPEAFPSGGAETLKETIGDLLGIKIHYFAALNLMGFKQAIDAIGGVDITVARAIADPVYSEDGIEGPGFYLDAGHYHMDGKLALAYVRSRHDPRDSDFTRAERQQEVLTAVQEKLSAGNLLVALPGLLDAVRNTIATDVPSSRIPTLADAVQTADMSRLERVVIQPPLVTPEEIPVHGYVLHPDVDAIRDLVDDILGEPDDRTSSGPSWLGGER